MVTIAAAVLLVGYSLFYVAGSNLAHGPGKGVGFAEVLGFGGGTPAASTTSPSSPASATSRTPAPGKPKPGTPTTQAQLNATVNRLAGGGKP